MPYQVHSISGVPTVAKWVMYLYSTVLRIDLDGVLEILWRQVPVITQSSQQVLGGGRESL